MKRVFSLSPFEKNGQGLFNQMALLPFYFQMFVTLCYFIIQYSSTGTSIQNEDLLKSKTFQGL